MIDLDDGGFQSEPEIILIRESGSNGGETTQNEENSNTEICSDLENDENKNEESEQNCVLQGDDEDETSGCPICLEPWTNSGRHRLCSLRCGHLFGRQCIDRWLAGGRIKCPQCNAPAKRADIRVLYCKSLMALDTSERDRLDTQIEAQKMECRRLEESLAQANLSAQILRAELESLKSENGLLKKRKFPSDDANILKRGPLKFLRRAILGHGPSFECRTMAFDPHYGIFLVSRSMEDSFGIVKVSLWDSTGSEFVSLHEGPVRAVACSPHGDGLFLTCGADESLKLSTMSSNSVLQTWKLPSSPWSCAFHPGSINHVAVGLSSGKIAIYDIRSPTAVLPKIYEITEGPSNYPVHSLFIINYENGFLLVGATLAGPFAIPLLSVVSAPSSESESIPAVATSTSISTSISTSTSSNSNSVWSSNFGYKNFTCCSLSLDPKHSQTFLASFRSVPPREASRHVIFELMKSENETVNIKLPFSEFRTETSVANKIPFRSMIHNLECFIPDESNFTGHCYASTESTPIEILSTNSGAPLIETCVGLVKQSTPKMETDESHGDTLVVGLLTQKHLYIYTA